MRRLRARVPGREGAARFAVRIRRRNERDARWLGGTGEAQLRARGVVANAIAGEARQQLRHDLEGHVQVPVDDERRSRKRHELPAHAREGKLVAQLHVDAGDR